MTPAQIAELIGSGRYDLTDEKRCQADIATLLAASVPECAVRREHAARLGPYDIPDFLIDGEIVVEVKMRGVQGGAVLRQLARYAAYPQVTALILVTNRALNLPAAVAGKPLLRVSLGRAWL